MAAIIIFIEWTGKDTPKSRNGSKVYMEIPPVVPGQEGDFICPRIVDSVFFFALLL